MFKLGLHLLILSSLAVPAFSGENPAPDTAPGFGNFDDAAFGEAGTSTKTNVNEPSFSTFEAPDGHKVEDFYTGIPETEAGESNQSAEHEMEAGKLAGEATGQPSKDEGIPGVSEMAAGTSEIQPESNANDLAEDETAQSEALQKESSFSGGFEGENIAGRAPSDSEPGKTEVPSHEFSSPASNGETFPEIGSASEIINSVENMRVGLDVSPQDVTTLSRDILMQKLSESLQNYQMNVKTIESGSSELSSLERRLITIRADAERMRADAKSALYKIASMKAKAMDSKGSETELKQLSNSAAELVGKAKEALEELKRKVSEGNSVISAIERLSSVISSQLGNMKDSADTLRTILDHISSVDATIAKSDEKAVERKITEAVGKRDERRQEFRIPKIEGPSESPESDSYGRRGLSGAFRRLWRALSSLLAWGINSVARFLNWLSHSLLGT